ncbi:uncharacterized protein N0V89_009014 [Didymosphaeria variabile]|uniref:ATPase domain-containing protein n=1 Tax=Didymosphaeria variabile TaxID=1932322 RepID=A0A9W9C9D1_9PLEO|nr:uncharacterized protein N0V89_009014 [Didymosphaeria variabile]KAJ4350393.1 hypothetical protein N0V89_009014 [Didymosphaeria variabile]
MSRIRGSSALRHLSRPRVRSPLPAKPWQACTARSFFGLGELAGVIANPAETLRQLKESQDMLRKAKEDMELAREAKKIPKKHTFSKLPGFHGRKAEQALLRKILNAQPKMTTIFGATSVGKTALLREVLATDDYFVVKFDLRISGFADLRTLYLALCEQFQIFFNEMHDEEMGKQALTFKHLILALNEKESAEGGYTVTVADLASLMESLQSALLKYWEYDPKETSDEDGNSGDLHTKKKPAERKVESSNDTTTHNADTQSDKTLFRKRPVVFLLDEAHKLPALVDDQLSLKVFLDTLLVLTKQDRLCHVLFCTSDPFFQHFLRSMNVGHHSQLITIGDCSREETLSYFLDQMLRSVPPHLASNLTTHFDDIWDAFGGKLSHINDYVASWVQAEGRLTPYQSAIFIQAYTLLQFHLTQANFETFSPLSTATVGTDTSDDTTRFEPEDLLRVMRTLTQLPYSIPYFTLCRLIGTAQVDSMIKTRVLEVRWTRTVTPEEGWVERQWSEDGIERPVVLPMTRMIRKAMEVVLREEEELRQAQAQGDEPVDEAKTT